MHTLILVFILQFFSQLDSCVALLYLVLPCQQASFILLCYIHTFKVVDNLELSVGLFEQISGLFKASLLVTQPLPFVVLLSYHQRLVLTFIQVRLLKLLKLR